MLAGNGQTLTVLSFGPGFEWKVGSRARIGLSPTLSVHVFDDDRGTGAAVGAVALGLWGDLSVDLIKRKSGAALFAAGRLGYDYVVTPDGGLDSLVARAWIGYRF